MIISTSFSVPVTWLSLAGLTVVFNKTTKVVMIQLTNDKKFRLTKKQLAHIMRLPVTGPFYDVSVEHVVSMFNEMGHQPPLTGLSHFRKTDLPWVWNFLFGIFLRCLTGRSLGLDKAKLVVYAMIVGLYYDLNVDYATQLREEFYTGINHTSVTNRVSCARYWSLILRDVYEKQSILVPLLYAKMEFSMYQAPKIVTDDPALFHNMARIPDVMLRKVDPDYPILVNYFSTINPDVQVGVYMQKWVE